MDRPTEIRLARSPYNWLSISPILTIGTLFFIVSSEIGTTICGGGAFVCDYDTDTYLSFAIGIFVSSLWHLILLQYVNNKDSEFVRSHGQRALTQAGIRTGVAMIGLALDWFSGAEGGIACITVIILLIIWVVNTTQYKKWVDSNSPLITEASFSTNLQSYSLVKPTEEMLAQAFADLQSEDDVTVLLALEKLEGFTEATDEILKQLEALADGHNNMDVRTDARVVYNRLNTKPSFQAIRLEENVSNTDPRKPEMILNEIYQNLQSKEDATVLQAMTALQTLNYSSEAIRRQLEKLAVNSENAEVRNEALDALNMPANRAVQRHVSANKLDRGARYTLLQEITDWEKNSLIEKQNADVIRRRYDFDLAPAATTAAAPQAQPAAASPQTTPPTPQKSTPATPPEPRPTLLQTLTSEASIKIYLYLGAFFVIAAAAILGAVVPELRLPILIIGTFIFGGLAVAIKKRLPQPSFALFIVFSFLLPITANSLIDTLRVSFSFNDAFINLYWIVVFLIMAGIWGGSTWLYESRLFSLTSFASLILAFYRIGDAFEAKPVIYPLLLGFPALAGLTGTWLLKKWKDDKFSLPIFLASQLLQAGVLVASLVIFGIDTFEPPSNYLLTLAAVPTWGMATVFFILSNSLYPYFVFPWLAAATLVPIPWFIATAFDLESFGSSIVLFTWGALVAIASELLRRLELTKKYGLPILLASLPSLALAIFTGFFHEVWLGLTLALCVAILFAILHILQTRWWLWTLSLLSAVIAYFAFFELEVIHKLHLFFGYELVGITILFLLPDLFLKKDWSHAPAWRLPLRIFGALFLFVSTFALTIQNNSGHIAISYGILAFFCAVYVLAYQKPYLGYIPAAYLPLAMVYTFDKLDIDAWLPALTAISLIYYIAGAVLRKTEKWGDMLRYSGMAMGTITAFTALILLKETGGWYVLGLGLIFIAEMYLTHNGLLEIGAPFFFTAGIFLVLHHFKVEQAPYHLLAYSLVWLIADLLAHLTFTNPRPLSILVRAIGGLLALINFGYLFAEQDPWIPVIGFGIYALLFLTISLLYRQPILLYTFTLTLPLFVTFLFRTFEVTQWIHPVIVLAMVYYGAGVFLRATNRAKGWDLALLYSGLGIGVVVSIGAPILGGLDASIPVAIAATLWAFEAFAKRNAWLAFPANALYLLAYFIILVELNVDEPQFFSMGTALFGLIQHYLLTRANSKSGTFIMGMFSQFVLLGTTYIEMLNKNDLNYFFLLFIQSLVILVYGIVIRSRSLTFFPIGFVALGVVTVVYSALKDIGTIFVIGCTGIILLMLGIGAVLLRERIAKLGERLSDWKA